MLAIAEIKSWLNSDRDYSTGLNILKRYSNSPMLVLLSKGEDAFNKKKLTQLIYTSLEEFEKHLPVGPEVTHKNDLYPKQDNKATTKIISLTAERKALYIEVNHLKSKTIYTPEGDGLKDLAFEIVKKWQRIDEIWSIIDNYNETGELPQDAREVLVEKYNDPIKLKQQQSNLRSNISKIAKKIKAAGSDAKRIEELIDRKKKFEDELNVVELKLSEHER